MQENNKIVHINGKNILWRLFRVWVENEKVPRNLSKNVETEICNYFVESKKDSESK